MGNGMYKENKENSPGISDLTQKVYEAGRLSKYYRNSACCSLEFKKVSKRQVSVTIAGAVHIITVKEFYNVYNQMLESLPEVLDQRERGAISYEFDPICEICFERLAVHKIAGLTCGHGPFHRPCIKKWMSIGQSCPMCRRLSNIIDWKENNSNVLPMISTFISIAKSKHV